MNKFSLSLVLSLLTSSVFATTPVPQVAVSSLANHGSISNTVKSSAVVTGVGTSFSSATGAAGASSGGTLVTTINPVCGGSCDAKSGSFELNGNSSTYNTGTAFNVSTGAATGAASSTGTAKSDMSGSALYTGPGQWVRGAGNSVSSSGGSVAATTNTGGFFSAETAGTLKVTGLVGSKVCTGSTPCGVSTAKEVFGSVADVKNSVSSVATGTMTVDGKVLNIAPVNATATTVVNTTAAYGDPI